MINLRFKAISSVWSALIPVAMRVIISQVADNLPTEEKAMHATNAVAQALADRTNIAEMLGFEGFLFERMESRFYKVVARVIVESVYHTLKEQGAITVE